MVGNMPGGAELKKILTLDAKQFGLRWQAD